MTTNAHIHPNRFFSRDESWLDFNRRVLEEAEDDSNPLLERVKFLAITAGNLDEFVEIRVAGVLQRIEDGYDQPGEDGLTPQQTFDRVASRMQLFVRDQYRCWNEQLLPALARKGIRVLGWSALSDEAREFAANYYQNEVDPLMTPVTIDPSHPFPRVLNKALCVALLLRRKRKGAAPAATVLGVVTVPRALPRLVRLPTGAGEATAGADKAGADGPVAVDFIFLHDLIEAHATEMFRGYEILSKAAFRVTRNSNLYMEEEESRSVLESVRAELHNRRKGDAVRLEIESGADPEVVERLRTNFELDASQVFLTDGPVNLSRLMNLYTETPCPELKYTPFSGREYKMNKQSADIFEELRGRDILLHHPFDSYDTVVGFIESGASDPAVVSMKQTLYRTSADSPIFQALLEAGASKEVTVVVELMARFDEDSNIRWARNLEDAGVQVFHGIVGLKTHCKLALLVRRDSDGVTRRYAHLGTGNYNPVTARFYTDMSLMTAEPAMTAAVHEVFNYLTAEAEREQYAPLLVAPITLAQDILRLIAREAEHAKAGRPARIIAKMNALLDRGVIEALYAASQAGVEIDLIVRGMCALVPGAKGMSERIRVRSIVGRFLEHSRIFYFANGTPGHFAKGGAEHGKDEVYCGSADWMSRNLYERCEVVYPVRDPGLRARLRDEILAACLADTVKARVLTSSGNYIRANSSTHGRSKAEDDAEFNAQEFLMRLAEGSASVENIPREQGRAQSSTAAQKKRRPAKKSVAREGT